MKTVFALVSLLVAVQAMPQGGDAAPAVSTPACATSCISSILAACKPTDEAASKACFCDPSKVAVIAGCVVPACPSLNPNDLLALSAGVCGTGAASAGKPAETGASATGADAGKPAGTSAAGSGSASGSESAAETNAPTGAEGAAPTGAAPTGGEVASTGAGAGTGAATGVATGASTTGSAPTATGSGSAADRVVVGGSVLLAGFAALLAL